MNSLTLSAYAKLNLTLDITGREGGYHMLDSLVCTVDLCDRVRVRTGGSGVRISMRGMDSETIADDENNAYRAAKAFCEEFGYRGAEITVWKNIPIGAGLGGSSTDAAAVIAGMGRLFSVPYPKLKAFADSFGSDTGYLLKGGFARLTGRGERVEYLPGANFYALLICPQTGISTAACYAEFDRAGVGHRRTEAAISSLRAGDLAGACAHFGNDLYPAACALSEDAKRAYSEAASFSPMGAGMTGSGSAAFALFETRELAEWAKSRYRGAFRTFVTKSIQPKIKVSRSPFALGEGEGEEDLWQKND